LLGSAALAAEGSVAVPENTGAIELSVKAVSEEQKPIAGPVVTVITVEPREVTESIILSGDFVPREEILVQPEIDGQAVTEILVEAGDTVKKGQVLARLATSSIDVQAAQMKANLARSDAAIAQSRAQIDSAQVALEDANRSLGRAQQLLRSGSGTREQLDQRQTQARAAQAQLDAATQALAIAEADRVANQAMVDQIVWRLERAEVRAPADGVVSRRNVRVGSIASTQQDAMFRIIEDGDVELSADVPEDDLPRLREGQFVAVTVAGYDEPVKGEIRLISPEVAQQTRLGTVRIKIDKASPVSIGSFGRGVVELNRKTVMALPLTAVTFQADAITTQAVVDNRVETRRLKTGILGEGFVEVLEGVKQGDTIVARAGTFLRDGDQVTPVPLTEAKK